MNFDNEIIKNINVWDEFLTHDEFCVVLNEIEHTSKWELTGYSNDLPGARYFWYKDVINNEIIENIFRNKIEQYLNTKIKTTRIYCNGQAHGQCGGIHRDMEIEIPGQYGSLVWYFHKDWKPEYGGHIVMIDGDGGHLGSIWPKTNSAVLFNSKMQHCPLEPTVYCNTQRLSLAYKFQII